MSKMIKVKLTKDADLNRQALGPEMCEDIQKLRDVFGDVKLTEYSVEQGSDAAHRVSEAHAEYKRRHP